MSASIIVDESLPSSTETTTSLSHSASKHEKSYSETDNSTQKMVHRPAPGAVSESADFTFRSDKNARTEESSIILETISLNTLPMRVTPDEYSF